MANELTVIQFNGVVSNVNLQKQLTKINTAIVKSQKSSWEVAEAVHKILTEEMYAEDFEKEQDFANFLGMSRPTLNKMKRAVELKRRHNLVNDYSLSKVFEMLTIKDEEFDDFIESYAIVPDMTVTDIRVRVKAWNGIYGDLNAISGEELLREETKETEETRETEHETVTEQKKHIVSVYVDGVAMVNDCETTEDVVTKIFNLFK